MDEAAAAAWVAERLGWPGVAERLHGGLLNHVFRVRATEGRPRSVIVKHAPPHVATAPHIPLDQSRARFEAAALLAAQGRPSRSIGSPVLRAAEGATLAMEDLGDAPDLATWLLGGGDRKVLTDLGIGLRGLHQRSDAPALFNQPVQRTRLDVQYRQVGRLLHETGVRDADVLGARALALGERLCEPGHCWVHGDVWPASVLVVRDRVVLIDWELTTRGHRCQDLGHILAHLWMLTERRDLDPTACRRLLGAYGPISDADMEDTAVHMGCEILARSIGPFQDGYLYDGLSLDDPPLRYAVRVAAERIRSGFVVL